MDVFIGGAAIAVFVVLALLIRRRPDPVERALGATPSPEGKAELMANAERSRSIPPPSI